MKANVVVDKIVRIIFIKTLSRNLIKLYIHSICCSAFVFHKEGIPSPKEFYYMFQFVLFVQIFVSFYYNLTVNTFIFESLHLRTFVYISVMCNVLYVQSIMLIHANCKFPIKYPLHRYVISKPSPFYVRPWHSFNVGLWFFRQNYIRICRMQLHLTFVTKLLYIYSDWWKIIQLKKIKLLWNFIWKMNLFEM